MLFCLYNAPMSKLPKKVHIIGICGVATSALAIALHKRGVRVTGSDKGFFPPVSTELEKQEINFYAGWHVDKMVSQGDPDVVIIGTASGSHNPETLYVKNKGIKTYSFAEAIGAFFAKKNSIVCVGTWGKTSSSALLSFIFDYARWDPTYMFGGISLSHDSPARLSDGPWSIFEGDEYKSSPTDSTAKFFYYKPTHLLLTSVSWDHADLYPTENDYFATFKKLTDKIPSDGFIVACADNRNVSKVLQSFKGKITKYGKDDDQHSDKLKADYLYGDVTQSTEGINFTIKHDGKSFDINSLMMGAYQAENITGCFAMAHQFGISATKIAEAISLFKGLKRRLEKRLDGRITVIDDIAHSPEKASSVLNNLKQIYSGKITAIFEPNIGGRSRESILKYNQAFKDADEVIIPRLTKLKTTINTSEKPMEGDELASTISQTHPNTNYMEDDTKLVAHLTSKTNEGDVIVFLGSHGFRGMIEEVVTCLRQQPRS